MIHPPNSSHAQRAAMKLPTKNGDTDFMEQQIYIEVQTDPNRTSKNKGQKQEPWTPRAALADKEDFIPSKRSYYLRQTAALCIMKLNLIPDFRTIVDATSIKLQLKSNTYLV